MQTPTLMGDLELLAGTGGALEQLHGAGSLPWEQELRPRLSMARGSAVRL